MAKIKEKYWLNAEQAAFIVIDVQEKLVPAMDQELYGKVEQNLPLLMEGCQALNVPIIVTEQYPKGLGHTVPTLVSTAQQPRVEKVAFSCCGESAFLTELKKTGATQVLIGGMETHVCVLQTVIDLLDKGFEVHLVSDAVSSRFKGDYANALRLMEQAGAVITTTEIALFQMVKVAGGEQFKTVSRLVRQRVK